MNIDHIADLVIEPTLHELGWYSAAAFELVLGTGLHESGFQHLVQLDGDDDPYDDAIGFFQMEKKTHNDLWLNYLLSHKPLYREKIQDVCKIGSWRPHAHPNAKLMIWNLKYAVAMCRLQYLRVPEALPLAGDVEGMARYHNRFYNAGGKAKVSDYIEKWQRYDRR